MFHKCDLCPAGYSMKRLLAQHVKLVHAQPDEEQVENADDTGNDLGDDIGSALGDDKRSAEPTHSTSTTESTDWSGEKAGDEAFAAKERELADKEAELQNYEQIVKLSEKEAEKVANNIGDDNGDDLDDELGGGERSAGKTNSTSTTESADGSGEEDRDEELAAKERQLADKEAELRDYERIVEQSEKEAEKVANTIRDDLGDVLGGDERSSEPSHSTSGTVEGEGDEELAAKERQLAEKEAELRDYERIVEQSEEEADKVARARNRLLQELRTKYEHLCRQVGPEEAKRLFQKVTQECQSEINK